jgi:histidine kinase-like protein
MRRARGGGSSGRSTDGYSVAVVGDGSDQVGRRWRLTPEPTAARVARRLIRSACRDWAVHDSACGEALVVATELVTNVIQHAGTECELTVRIDNEGLRVEVRDFHPGMPPRPQSSKERIQRGWGLQAVALLSTQWGVTELEDGKSLWAVLLLPASSPVPRSH